MTNDTLPTAHTTTAEPYDLTVLFDKSIKASTAKKDYYREVHLLLKHLDTLLREWELGIGSNERRATNMGIKLPGGYTFFPSGDPAWAQCENYALYCGPRSAYRVVNTNIGHDGYFTFHSDNQHMTRLEENLKCGLLNEIAVYLTLAKRDRSLFLQEKRMICFDLDDEESEVQVE